MTSTMPNQQVTNYAWATTLLTDAGLPTTPNNVLNVTRWMVNENPASNWWNRNNPLNASLGNGSVDGTGSYPSLTVGAQYTAKMLQQTNMSSIYQALANNAPFPQFAAGVQASPWASSHYPGGIFSGTPATVTDAGGTLSPATGGGTLDNINTPTQTPNAALPGTCGYVAAGASPSGVALPLGAGRIFTNCQVKGIVGGMLVGLGAVLMMTGVVVLMGKSGSLRSAAGAAVGGIAGGPAGAATGAAVGRASAPAKAVATPVAAPSAEPVDTTVDDDTGDVYDSGFMDGIAAALASNDQPAPKNRRQANRQAADLFDTLGLSAPLGDTADLPF